MSQASTHSNTAEGAVQSGGCQVCGAYEAVRTATVRKWSTECTEMQRQELGFQVIWILCNEEKAWLLWPRKKNKVL
ncbi:uncharacterized protein SETTUDRAFT_158973 [Exserohilum turcica Et28A]|uniref:Uncharacterized protein n=1 Tax=Exserohilum turcicum (strain 28A) TaxID=671987 RepID=R0J0T6_EXST2|nr:uncharacterized protein SETTUDRAFT_158973 [Exserohilum turcica Et28A]EOA90381.1 hypothetical protein SETTUDRAFT_158973 [Exserohilum turcica Et28A]